MFSLNVLKCLHLTSDYLGSGLSSRSYIQLPVPMQTVRSSGGRISDQIPAIHVRDLSWIWALNSGPFLASIISIWKMNKGALFVLLPLKLIIIIVIIYNDNSYSMWISWKKTNNEQYFLLHYKALEVLAQGSDLRSSLNCLLRKQ